MTIRQGDKEKKKDAQVSKDISKTRASTGKGVDKRKLLKEAGDEAFWRSMEVDTTGTWIDVLKENGELELPDLSESKHLTRKAPQIMKLTGASQFLLKEKKILVGGSAFKSRVAKYVNIIVNKAVPDDYADNDFLRIFVSQRFADSVGDAIVSEVEHAEGVLVVVEKPSTDAQESIALLPGDFVEVETQPGVSSSMAKVMAVAEKSITIRRRDQLQEDVVLSRVRRARSIAIFGPGRLTAAIKIVAVFEKESAGALGALHDNPYFQGRRLGVISEELPVKAEVIQRLEKSPILKQIMLATSSSIHFFMKAVKDMKDNAANRRRSVPCVLVGGSLEERWRGLQSVKIIALAMEQKRHPTLPPSLLGDAKRVRIPEDMKSVVVGKRMEALLELMKSTNTVPSRQV